MAHNRRERFEKAQERLENDDNVSESDREAIDSLLDAYDPEVFKPAPPDDDSPRQAATLEGWTDTLRQWSHVTDADLVDADGDELANGVNEMLGDAAKSTVRQRQMCLRRFLRFHDAETDHDTLQLVEVPDSQVDPAEMLTSKEMESIRNAAGHPRDRALFDFLLYTGQRRQAALTLKWKHVDLADSQYRLNPDADGLKGADAVGTWRPLLGAKGAMTEWKRYHPDGDDPDAYVFVATPESGHYDPQSHMSERSPSRILNQMADDADVHKPVNPHALRHNFVSMAKRRYELQDDVIKRLLGHESDSSIMQRTYAHLSDDEYADRARQAFGLADDDEPDLTPTECPTCNFTPIPDHAAVCPNGCGTAFSPDARAAQQGAQAATHEAAKDAQTDDEKAAVDTFKKIVDDPELFAEALQDDGVKESFSEMAAGLDY